MKRTLSIGFVLALSGACGKSEPASAPPPPPPPALSAAQRAAAPTNAAGNASAPPAFAGFEGEIGLLIKGNAADATSRALTVLTKGAKLRFDPPASGLGMPHLGSVHVILDAPRKQMTALIDQKQQAVVLNLDTLKDELKQLAPPGMPEPQKTERTPPKLVKTGHRDQVAGYACEDWDLIEPNGRKLRLCVADQGASWLSLPNLTLPSEHAWAKEMVDGKHVPVRAVSFDERGQEGGRVELTKLTAQPVPDAMFEVPAGYQTVSVAELMGSMFNARLPAALSAPGQKGAPRELPPAVQEMMRKAMERAAAERSKRGKSQP